MGDRNGMTESLWRPVGEVAQRVVARLVARRRFGHVRRASGHGRVRRTVLGDQVEGWTLHQPGHC